MSRITYLLILMVSLLFTKMSSQTNQGQFATVNGLEMYYEIQGSGSPLVLIHGGGSTINSTYGNVLSQFAKKHKVIAVELQAHGRTKDRGVPLSFEQDADDVVALLQQLAIAKATVMGFSNGGTTALQIAIRHPEVVDKLILCSAAYSRAGLIPGFFEGMKQVTIDMMPAQLKEAFLQVNPDKAALQVSFDRDVERMLNFKDIPEEMIKAVKVPALVINADKDVIITEHAMALSRLLADAQLTVLPGAHGEYIGEVCSVNKASNEYKLTVELIEEFLADK
ncbi:alpha/beta fold hydrolase [Flavobacterium beibuense]|uniref:Alpha/beta hydrolase n=1 Tax=Flavobacterium beibuense TaxID=657326 RepID=A0A444W6F6_9FLAO|nr:alpha/beta hydrolase [Flavobacterium beibuense]RYJ41363.1 Alpha/beta hydrolase [Flavobacterium beibuense]